MEKITLIQPRHNYAPSFSKNKLGHIYMPTSLLTAASRLINVGLEVSFFDENIEPATKLSKNIGINLLGSPYIPVSLKLIKKIRKQNANTKIFLGGQVVNGLSEGQFIKIYGKNVFNGNSDIYLASNLGFKLEEIISPQKTSLINAYKLISDKNLKLYLQNEFSLYLSQGCRYACEFCAAKRTFIDENGVKKRPMKETYRCLNIVKKDLEYLILKAKSFSLNNLTIYLSNLDMFQTQSKLNDFCTILEEINLNFPNFKFNFRGLSTTRSFMHVHKKNPELIFRLKKLGLSKIGFGVDGSPEIWKSIGKNHNDKNECLNAIRITREIYQIIPETLMVFGHNAETEKSLSRSVDIANKMSELYGAIPRPHAAKDIIPGNLGWIKKENTKRVSELIENPESFQCLDFTALPSRITHPNNKLSKLAKKYYLKMCNLPLSETLYTLPILPEYEEQKILEIKNFNLGRYDH